MKKILFTVILLMGLAYTGQAQSEKIKIKATEKVEELNNEIISVDKSLALSDIQREQIYKIHVERITAYRKANKSGASDEDKKELQKKYFQKIYKDVLTNEQKKAKKQSKENSTIED